MCTEYSKQRKIDYLTEHPDKEHPFSVTNLYRAKQAYYYDYAMANMKKPDPHWNLKRYMEITRSKFK
jgi:hypothetical protein